LCARADAGEFDDEGGAPPTGGHGYRCIRLEMLTDMVWLAVDEQGCCACASTLFNRSDLPGEVLRRARGNACTLKRAGPDGDLVLDFSALTRDQAAALGRAHC
jgi:hypothetical protein